MLRLAVLTVLAFPVLTLAQEKIDNPTYASWAKAKKGTTVVLKMESEAAGQKTETVVTQTLLDLNDEKAIVEQTTLIKVAGMEIKSPASKMEHLKQVPLPAGVKKEDFGKPMGAFESGSETLKIGDKEYKTTWHKAKIKAAGNDIESQTWICNDVPGMIVKSLTSTSGAVKSTTSMQLVEIKMP